MSGDFDVVDIEGTFDKIVVMNCSSELIRCYGKISVLHLTSERFAQRLVETLGTVDVPLIAGHKERSEEWDALDMWSAPLGVDRYEAVQLAICRACSLDGAFVSQRRVATLGIIDVFDEARQRGSDVVKGLVLHQVDLLDFERLYEALSLGIVIGVATSAHRTLEAVLG